MGAVIKARQPQLDRFVALKLLASERTDDARFSERFQREAQALARLSHPHIAIYPVGPPEAEAIQASAKIGAPRQTWDGSARLQVFGRDLRQIHSPAAQRRWARDEPEAPCLWAVRSCGAKNL